MKTTAAVLNGVNQDFEFEDIIINDPKSNEVRVRIVASGVCHTDAAVRSGDMPMQFPVVLGHEGAGIIEEIGDEVTDFKVGDHVVISFASCGTCEFCRAGLPGACLRFNELNLDGVTKTGARPMHTEDGQDIGIFFGQSSFSKHTIIDQNNIVKVDDDVDLRVLGPLGCGFMTGSGTVLNSLSPEPGSTLAIFGTGAVGLAGIMAGKIANAGHIIAVDINDERLEIARKLGATDTINSTKEDVVSRIQEISGGHGARYAMDTTGIPAVLTSAVKSLSIKGELATVAVGKMPLDLDVTRDVMMPSRTIKGVIEGDAVPQLFIPKLVEFYHEGQFNVDELSKFYAYTDINQAFEDSKNGVTVKPILILDESYTV